jgi:heterotetrameric sarcosine oxidase delta subunit
MSFLLTCPNCGPRDVGEFRYGGELLHAAPGTAREPASNLPGQSTAATPAQGFSNQPGRQRERWFHRHGCRRWLEAERDVCTNEVARSGWLSGEAR